MKFILFIGILFSALQINAQLISQGSFYIVASGVDGIIIAADNRSTLSAEKTNVALGYHDAAVKIFTFGNVAMAFTGHEVFSGKYLFTIVEEFKKTLKGQLKVSEVLPQFFKYCSQKFNKEDYQKLLSNGYVVTGYEKGKPTMCLQERTIESRECVTEDWIRSAYDGSEFEVKYFDTLNCSQIAKLSEASIKKYAVDKKAHAEVGDAISILKITKTGTEWLQNKPQLKWRDFNFFLKDYLSGKVQVNFTSPQNKAEFEAIVKANYQLTDWIY